MNTSLCGFPSVPSTAPGRSTQDGSPGLQTPSFTAASQYPCFVFHTSSRPSLSVFLTVVLTITAPQDTHPCWLLLGTTMIVAEGSSAFTGFGISGYFWSPKVQVGLSQL